MTLLKNSWALALMILSLLFLPQEKLAFWFSERPQDWYGEFAIVAGGRKYVFVKNRSPYAVALRNNSAQIIAARSLSGSTLGLIGRAATVPRDVYAFLVEDQSQVHPRREFTGMTTDFEPPHLYVGTEAEDDLSIMLLLLGAALTACLGLSVGLFFHEAALLEAGNTKVNKSP
jgi:hypothetical protein